jgi:hypothetical protein
MRFQAPKSAIFGELAISFESAPDPRFGLEKKQKLGKHSCSPSTLAPRDPQLDPRSAPNARSMCGKRRQLLHWHILATSRPNLEPNIGCTVVWKQSEGSSTMRDYRAYILGIDGHRFVKVKDFLSDQPDDATALSAAKQLADGHEVELWDCGRLVARLSPDGEVNSPELAPFKVSAALSESGSSSSKPPVEAISLGRVSELAGAPSNENHLLLGW